MKQILNLKNINKTYQMGKEELHALSDINLTINQGEYLAILGPSGSGKSTLMNILGCLDTPSSGEYKIDNQLVSNMNKSQLAEIRNKKIGFIFQSFNLLEYLNAYENVALPLVYAGVNFAKRKNLAIEMLEKVGLADRIYHLPNELSGGQRQRVAIARAIVTNPEIILADEPTGNLDSKSGAEIIKLFETFLALNKTIIIVTHDKQIASRCKRIIEIGDGLIKRDELV